MSLPTVARESPDFGHPGPEPHTTPVEEAVVGGVVDGEGSVLLCRANGHDLDIEGRALPTLGQPA